MHWHKATWAIAQWVITKHKDAIPFYSKRVRVFECMGNRIICPSHPAL